MNSSYKTADTITLSHFQSKPRVIYNYSKRSLSRK